MSDSLASALFAALVLTASLSAGPARAQPALPRPPSPVGGAAPAVPPPPATRPAGRDAYALAVQELANGRVAEATALLEDLLSADRGQIPVALKLQEAYEAAGRTDDALHLADARDIGGPTAAGVAERGRVLARAGRLTDARQAWDAALALAADEPGYRAVADALAASRLYAEAAAVLERGHDALGGGSLFLLERANLYGLALDYGRAADLYLSALADRPDAAAGVRGRLARLLPGTGASEAFRAAVEREMTRDPLNRAYRELASWLALERRDYDAALDGVRALDRLDREEGESLLNFARTAMAAGATDVAARALDEILARHPDGFVAPFALLDRAGLAERLSRDVAERAPAPTPHAEVAREVYRTFRERYPGLPEAATATLALAHLERDVFLDFDAAEALLDEAAAGTDADAAARARLDLGDVAVRRGDLEAARERYQTVEESLRTGPLAEQARFELALVDFYDGFVLSALARLEAIDENTAADATNDAIALRVTLNENADEDSTSAALKSYAGAALRVRQGRDALALARLDSLHAALPGHELADEILFLSAQAQRRLGRPAEAVATLDRLQADTPLSFFCDRALVLQAEIAERDLADPAAAAVRLGQLLERYPGSLFAPDAREKLPALRAAS